MGINISPGPERRILLLKPVADNSLLGVSDHGILAGTLVEGPPSQLATLIVGETTARGGVQLRISVTEVVARSTSRVTVFLRSPHGRYAGSLAGRSVRELSKRRVSELVERYGIAGAGEIAAFELPGYGNFELRIPENGPLKPTLAERATRAAFTLLWPAAALFAFARLSRYAHASAADPPER